MHPEKSVIRIIEGNNVMAWMGNDATLIKSYMDNVIINF